MLYQLSHFRSMTDWGIGAESQIRTGDTAIFSRVLYQLSYLGPSSRLGVVNHKTSPTDKRRGPHPPRRSGAVRELGQRPVVERRLPGEGPQAVDPIHDRRVGAEQPA